MNIYSNVIIPVIGKSVESITVSKKDKVYLHYLDKFSDNISFFIADIRIEDNINETNFSELKLKYEKKVNLLKLFCFLQNPLFLGDYFIFGNTIKDIGYVNSSLGVKSALYSMFQSDNIGAYSWGINSQQGLINIDSQDVQGFYILLDISEQKNEKLEFILQIISSVIDSKDTKIKFLLLCSLLEFILITSEKRNKEEDSIRTRFAQRISIARERFVFNQVNICKDERFQYERVSGESSYKEILKLYDIRSSIIHGSTRELKNNFKIEDGVHYDLGYYYSKLAFAAKYIIETFFIDKQFIELLRGDDYH